jgi:hypothetical protein
MMNLEKLFSEAENKDKVKHFAHFEKLCFFRKTTPSEYLLFFDRKEVLAKAKKWIFVISSSNSIKSCTKNANKIEF